MTSKTKTVNYTPEMVADMLELYDVSASQQKRDAIVDELAAKFGKTRRSVISKLSREGVYVTKKVISKVTGEKPAKKEELAKRLAEVSGVPLVSGEKLNKTDLQGLISAFELLGQTEE